MKQSAMELIAAERVHQAAKGYDARHDDLHVEGEIAAAAACYAVGTELHTVSDDRIMNELIEVWPFEGTVEDAVEGKDRLRCLVIAGALIVAEIERLQRAQG